MDSDTDHFESADEEFTSDHDENIKQPVKNYIVADNSNVPDLQVENITLQDSTLIKDEEKISEKTEQIEKVVHNKTEDSTSTEIKNTIQKQKTRVNERKERSQKTKAKLGTKLGTKITENKDNIFKEKFEEITKNEYSKPAPTVQECWEEVNDEIKPVTPEKNNLNKNDKIEHEESSNNWGNWGSWGVSSLLSTAQLSVSTITNSVSQSITTVLESGIGVPDPEQLAKIDMEEIQKQKDILPEKENLEKIEEKQVDSLFGLGNLVSGVTHITKLVETTGTKVLVGGLDTLETIGKKTFEVLQEGDPGLKKKRALFKIGQDKPVLSQILREAKEKAEQENKLQHISKKPQYETIFDDYQGLVHLEALEMLSKQCDIKLEALMSALQGNRLQDMQETMLQIKELCELPDEDEDSILNVESVREKIDSALSDMNISISYTHFLDSWMEIENWLEKELTNEENIHQKAIESLAQLTAIAVEQFHKAAELLLVKERRSTVDEADSLVQLTITLTGVTGAVAGKFSEKLNSLESQNVNNFITNIFLEAANSSSYIQDAFNLMIPILQVGAV